MIPAACDDSLGLDCDSITYLNRGRDAIQNTTFAFFPSPDDVLLARSFSRLLAFADTNTTFPSFPPLPAPSPPPRNLFPRLFCVISYICTGSKVMPSNFFSVQFTACRLCLAVDPLRTERWTIQPVLPFLVVHKTVQGFSFRPYVWHECTFFFEASVLTPLLSRRLWLHTRKLPSRMS